MAKHGKLHTLSDSANHGSTTLSGLNALISDGDIAPVIKSRITITSTTTFDEDNQYVSINAASAVVSGILDLSPVDGQLIEIKAINVLSGAYIEGTIDGESNYTFSLSGDSLKLLYNSDVAYWEIR